MVLGCIKKASQQAVFFHGLCFRDFSKIKLTFSWKGAGYLNHCYRCYFPGTDVICTVYNVTYATSPALASTMRTQDGLSVSPEHPSAKVPHTTWTLHSCQCEGCVHILDFSSPVQFFICGGSQRAGATLRPRTRQWPFSVPPPKCKAWCKPREVSVELYQTGKNVFLSSILLEESENTGIN